MSAISHKNNSFTHHPVEKNVFDFIPRDIYLVIFSFLGAAELCNIGKVCRLWNKYSKEEALWKNLFTNDFPSWIPNKPFKNTTMLKMYKRAFLALGNIKHNCFVCGNLSGTRRVHFSSSPDYFGKNTIEVVNDLAVVLKNRIFLHEHLIIESRCVIYNLSDLTTMANLQNIALNGSYYTFLYAKDSLIGCVNTDGWIDYWSLKDFQFQSENKFITHDHIIIDMAVHNDQFLFVVNSAPEKDSICVHRFNEALTPGSESPHLQKLEGPNSRITQIYASDKFLVSAYSDHSLVIWDIQTFNKVVTKLEAHTCRIMFLKMVDNILFSNGDDGLCIWEISSAMLYLRNKLKLSQRVSAIASIDSGFLVASSIGDVWLVDRQTMHIAFSGYKSYWGIQSLVFSHGKLLSLDNYGNLHLWNLHPSKEQLLIQKALDTIFIDLKLNSLSNLSMLYDNFTLATKKEIELSFWNEFSKRHTFLDSHIKASFPKETKDITFKWLMLSNDLGNIQKLNLLLTIPQINRLRYCTMNALQMNISLSQ